MKLRKKIYQLQAVDRCNHIGLSNKTINSVSSRRGHSLLSLIRSRGGECT